MTAALCALVCAAALEGTHLVTSLAITTQVDGRREPAQLQWVVRRDANERGVVPHDSGWMSYGATPWLNHHLAVVTEHGGRPSVRWMSSGLELDGLFVEGEDVVVRWRGALTRYVFRGWRLERSPTPPEASETKARLAASFDTGLVHLAVVGDVMVGRATARALDSVGAAAALAAVGPVLRRADLRLGNLESCFSGTTPRPGPLTLTAPLRRVDVLREAGFDVLSLANNHCDDADAAFSARVLADAGIRGATAAPVVLHTQGSRLTVLGLSLWPTRPSLLDARLAAVLEQARAAGGPLVVLVHWGDEYASAPSPAQREAAAWLFDHGATLVLGAHPHVLQPIEQPTTASLVAYSLGNFLFDQEGYPTGAGGKTEETAVLEVRLHRTLGVTWRATPFRITGRARLEPR
ncbi:MAG: CapA family protein [Myxococcus sp.]|nr:CapA family protein [Myxococcus sp.]